MDNSSQYWSARESSYGAWAYSARPQFSPSKHAPVPDGTVRPVTCPTGASHPTQRRGDEDAHHRLPNYPVVRTAELNAMALNPDTPRIRPPVGTAPVQAQLRLWVRRVTLLAPPPPLSDRPQQGFEARAGQEYSSDRHIQTDPPRGGPFAGTHTGTGPAAHCAKRRIAGGTRANRHSSNRSSSRLPRRRCTRRVSDRLPQG